MKRKLSILFALAITMMFVLPAQAQTLGGPEFMRKKVVLGSNFGLGIYGNRFYVGLAPQAGYRLTRSLEVGVRLGYDLNYYYGNAYYGSYFCHYFSGAAYANLEIFRGLYIHAEDEEMCLLVRGQAIDPSAPRWYNSVFVGVGYRQYTYSSSFAFVSLLYNLSWDNGYVTNNASPYISPFIVRVGYCVAL